MGFSNKQNDFDDNEIDCLESLRRYGHSSRFMFAQNGYYSLPPSRTEMMNDWRQWRTNINDVMTDLMGKVSSGQMALMADACMKSPEFFKGTMYIHGKRVKDQYGGEAINEQDSKEARTEKKIMEENFFLFGIPRISLHKESSSGKTKLPCKNLEVQHNADSLHKTALGSPYEKNMPSCRLNLVTGQEFQRLFHNSNNRSNIGIPYSVDSNHSISLQSSTSSDVDEHIYCEINSTLMGKFI